MGHHKKQHYVQQSYLRRFSPNEKQIYVYDKVLGKEFLNGIPDVAQESHFYRLPEGMESSDPPVVIDDPLIVEKAFQKIESRFNKSVQTLIDLPVTVTIPAEVRENLSVFITIQLLRTRAYRNLIVETAEKLARAITNEAIKEKFGEEALKYAPKIEFKDKAAGLLQSKLIFDFDKIVEYAKMIRNHIWILGINNTGKSLYTSDNPVVMHSPLKDYLPAVGIASPGVEIAFPLSSTRVLTVADRAFYGLQENAFDGKSRNLEAENVTYYNSLQVLGSERQIYCEQPDFDLVKDVIKKNPALGEIKRDRVEIEIK
jgi:hypothetical protein